MNKEYQRKLIEQRLIKLDIDVDLVDLDAEIDETLSYQENLDNILNKFYKLERPK